MANVVINDEHLTSIADAIRGKNGETTTYKPAEMADAISAITGAGGNWDYSQLHSVVISGSNLTSYLSGDELIVGISARGYPSGYSSQNIVLIGFNGDTVPALEGKVFSPCVRYEESGSNYGTDIDFEGEELKISTSLKASGTVYYSELLNYVLRGVHVYYYLPKEEA